MPACEFTPSSSIFARFTTPGFCAGRLLAHAPILSKARDGWCAPSRHDKFQTRGKGMSTGAVHRATHVTGIAPQFLVDDLERAIAYYCDKLGFEVDFRYQSFYAAVKRDGFAIHLKHAPKLAADRA